MADNTESLADNVKPPKPVSPPPGRHKEHQDGKKPGKLIEHKASEDHTDEGHGIGVYRGYEGEASTVKRKKAPGMFMRVKEELQALWSAFKPSSSTEEKK